MNLEDYSSAIEDVIYLASCMVNGQTPDVGRVERMDMEELFKVADKHLLTCIVGYGLEAAGVHDPAFTQAKAKAIRKIILMDAERSAVLKKLDEAGIWYLPMKGAILKELYPKIGMRQMSDNDILFDADRAADVRTIMESLGFCTKYFGKGSHDIYEKEPVSNFEMHRELYSEVINEQIADYYRDVKSRLLRDDSGSGFHFSDEDFYIFMIVHEYKHYMNYGTGLRSPLDAYVYCTKKGSTLDWQYIAGEFERLGIADFEARNRSLALNIFGNGQISEEDREMLDYVLSSGTYGSVENGVKHRLDKYGRFAKLRYASGRVFLPMKTVRKYYPIFARVPILLPILPLYRAFQGLRKNRQQIKAELKSLLKLRQHKQ